MSIQDLVSRIEQAKASIQESRQQFNSQKGFDSITIDRPSYTINRDAGISAEISDNSGTTELAKENTDSRTKTSCGMGDQIGGFISSLTDENISNTDRVAGAAAGLATGGVVGGVIGATRPDLLDDYLYGSVKGAAVGAVEGALTGIGSGPGVLASTAIGAAGGAITGGISEVADEVREDSSEDNA